MPRDFVEQNIPIGLFDSIKKGGEPSFYVCCVMFVVVIYKYISNRGICNSAYLIYD